MDGEVAKDAFVVNFDAGKGGIARCRQLRPSSVDGSPRPHVAETVDAMRRIT